MAEYIYISVPKRNRVFVILFYMLVSKSRPQYIYTPQTLISSISDHFMEEYIGAAKCYPFTIIPNINIYCTAWQTYTMVY